MERRPPNQVPRAKAPKARRDPDSIFKRGNNQSAGPAMGPDCKKRLQDVPGHAPHSAGRKSTRATANPISKSDATAAQFSQRGALGQHPRLPLVELGQALGDVSRLWAHLERTRPNSAASAPLRRKSTRARPKSSEFGQCSTGLPIDRSSAESPFLSEGGYRRPTSELAQIQSTTLARRHATMLIPCGTAAARGPWPGLQRARWRRRRAATMVSCHNALTGLHAKTS